MRVCGDYCQVKRFQAMQADVKASLSESDSPVVEHAEPAAKTAAKRFRQTVTTVWYVCECVCVGSPLVVECWGVVTVHHDRSMHLEALPPAAVTLLRVASLLGPNNIPGVYALVLVNWCRILDAADAVCTLASESLFVGGFGLDEEASKHDPLAATLWACSQHASDADGARLARSRRVAELLAQLERYVGTPRIIGGAHITAATPSPWCLADCFVSSASPSSHVRACHLRTSTRCWCRR